MKTKFVLLIALALFFATASQAQFHDSNKDSREPSRSGMTYKDASHNRHYHHYHHGRYHHHHHGRGHRHHSRA
ncbi:MAG TPA: hypothetical protein VG890_12205 [Puia sp.]|nr:hypothetical protein [Puia sp.]